ncbi:translation initiation factor IF-2 subunit beta [Candidatus Nanohalococcus occultus]|uniref:Translation initiation factor 2 subunit beta n=1 Tax=Candidatus Nanohalococcus occultus TaxID=2978047 RepID=A0ABY8CG76_9ARCH|nr:Translation initiation factor 2, beta subunit (eIF-2beta)/eIF-5 N-terminal domain [Candidatus Nanohaloarchaeota archaeon SVXNc]
MKDYDELLDKGMEEVPDEVGNSGRFEVPEVKTRKDGSKTILENFQDFVKKFNRDEKHLSKFIQNELGTAGHIKNGELVLNGEFRRGNIQGRIENYTNEYLYCPECESPDTEMVKEKGVQLLKCQACGARNPL